MPVTCAVYPARVSRNNVNGQRGQSCGFLPVPVLAGLREDAGRLVEKQKRRQRRREKPGLAGGGAPRDEPYRVIYKGNQINYPISTLGQSANLAIGFLPG